MADLKALIKQGEDISVGFKECWHTLSQDIYETVCAFLNRHGGDLLLGVSNVGAVTGVDPDCVDQIKKDFVTVINNPHDFGLIDPANFAPLPKNLVIARFFREIHRADELGSGMRHMMKYGKAYGGEDSEMIEGDVFRIVVKVPEFSATAPQRSPLKSESGAQSETILQVLGGRFPFSK